MADRNETQLINLGAIQRVDPTITNIIDNSTQTALYEFDVSSMQWEKTEIEGTFFIYKRSQSPHFGYIILNRLNTTNKIEPVTEIADTNVVGPYLMYLCKSGDIYGIWFYDEEDCVRISKQIAMLVHASSTIKKRRQRCASESDSQTPTKLKNEKFNERNIIAILVNAQKEFNQRNNTPPSLRSVPSLQRDLDQANSPSPEKGATDKKVQPFLNDSSVKDCVSSATSSTSVTPRKRFLSSGTPGSKSSCNKQFFENSAQDLPPSARRDSKPSCSKRLFQSSAPDSLSSSRASSVQEARSQFLKSRTLSLDSTPKKKIFGELLGERHHPDLESSLKSVRLGKSSFTSTDGQIPEEALTPVMTPEMFEQTEMSLKEPPCFEVSNELCNGPPLSCCLSRKEHIPGMHQRVPPFQPVQTQLKSVYSPQDFQNSPDLGNGFLTSGESNCPVENVPPYHDSQTVSKEQLTKAVMHLVANDSSVLSKIHEAYISSLKTHLNNSKK